MTVIERLQQQVDIRGTASPFGALAADALAEIDRMRSVLADIKAWDVEQFMTLPHDLRARIQAEMVPNRDS